MNRFLSRATAPALLAAAGAGLALPAAAQLQYRSAFQGYRSFGETEVKDWRASNDTVREIGGWRTYARETGAAQAGPKAPSADATVAVPAATPPGTPAAPPQVERRP